MIINFSRVPYFKWLSIAIGKRKNQESYNSTDEDHFDGLLKINRVCFWKLCIHILYVRRKDLLIPKSVTYKRESLIVDKEFKVETTFCDGCELQMGQDDYNTLIVTLNEELCVSSKFRRFYCIDCIEPVWINICKIIKADPEDDSVNDFKDD